MGKVSFPLHNVRKDILNNWHLEHITEEIQVPEEADEYGFFSISLIEIPESSAETPIKIDGLTEFRSSPYDSKSKKYVLPPNQFWVNYFTGQILFHRNQAGNSFTVDYYGKGSLVEADDVNDLDERVNTNISAISALQTATEDFSQTVEDVNTLKENVEGLNSSINTINEGLATVNNTLENKADIGALETAIDETRAIAEGYISAGGEVEQIVDAKLLEYTPAAEFTPVKESSETNAANITTLQEEVSNLSQLAVDLEKLDQAIQDIEEVQQSIETISTSKADVSTVNTLSEEVETVKTAAGNNTESITGLTSRVETLEGAGYITEEALSDLATKEEIPDVSNFATKEEIPSVDGLASEEFVTNKISEIEIPDVTPYAKSSELSGLVAINGTNASSAQHKIITKKNNKDLTAMIWNEESGGGAQFKNENVGKISFIGVNNGEEASDIWVQGYAKNISNNTGTRITLTTDGFYYTKNQNNSSYTADDEVLVKKDLPEFPDMSDVAMKSDIPDVSNFATKEEIPSVDGLASEEFVTNKISEIEIPDVSEFVKSSDVETAISAAGHVKASELNGLVSVNGVNAPSAQHKVITQSNNKNLTALLFNESDGGGSQFKNEAVGKISFIGVNNGADDNEIWVQGYAKNISTNIGTRLTLTTEGMYYTKNQANGSYTADDEIIVKKDTSNFVVPTKLSGLVAVDGVNVSSAQHKIVTKKNDKNITSMLWNESSGGGSQMRNEDAGKVSFIGVNNGDGDNEIWVQGYAKNISNNTGARITLSTTGFFYTKNQANGSYTEGNEVLTKSDLVDVNTQLEDSYETSTTVDLLLDKIAVLEKKLAETRNQSNVVPQTIVSGTTIYNDNTADMVFTSGDTVVAKTTVNAKSVNIQEMAAENASINIKATDGDVTITNFENSGTVAKDTQGNAQISINTDEYVSISDCTFGANGYNSLEIGLSNTTPKSVTINNCVFNGNLSNNAINIFAQTDKAVITISNCTFENVSNVLRISNRTNTSATFTFVNCTFNKWESGSEYTGAILCQDYTNTSAEACVEANLFAPEKIKINFVNCIGPDGNKIVGSSNPADYSGSGNDNQLVYVYCNKGGGVVAYDANRYPEVSFK